MRHLRKDYDAIQPFPVKRQHYVMIDGEKRYAGDGTVANAVVETLGKHMEPIIPDDEPVFLLRGRDPSASATVHYWAEHVAKLGGDPELVARVHDWAEEMRQYAEERVADTPDEFLR